CRGIGGGWPASGSEFWRAVYAGLAEHVRTACDRDLTTVTAEDQLLQADLHRRRHVLEAGQAPARTAAFDRAGDASGLPEGQWQQRVRIQDDDAGVAGARLFDGRSGPLQRIGAEHRVVE